MHHLEAALALLATLRPGVRSDGPTVFVPFVAEGDQVLWEGPPGSDRSTAMVEAQTQARKLAEQPRKHEVEFGGDDAGLEFANDDWGNKATKGPGQSMNPQTPDYSGDNL